MVRRVAVACVFALGISTGAYAQSGSPATIHGVEFFGGRSIIVDRSPPLNTSGHDDLLWRHRTVVRADGRGPAQQEILGQRLSCQLGLPAGADRRQSLCGYRRRRFPGSGRDLRVVPRRYADRSRFRTTAPRSSGRPIRVRRPGQRLPYVRTGWSGDNVGDLLMGVKVNLMSDSRTCRPARSPWRRSRRPW